MTSVGGALRVDVAIAAGAPGDITAETLGALARFALRQEGRTGPLAVSLVVTDDATIQALHATHMGIDAPTDVLSFVLDDDDAFVSAEEESILGEVVVSYETAAAQAATYGHDTTREVHFLIVHGVLHLLGYDDATDRQRSAMLARQEAILSAFERQAPRRA
jgi:probable rRNA maturation factor